MKQIRKRGTEGLFGRGLAGASQDVAKTHTPTPSQPPAEPESQVPEGGRASPRVPLAPDLFMWQFTQRQYSIISLILSLSGEKGYAVIPRLKDFQVCGVSKTKIKDELEALERDRVIDWDRLASRYRIRFDRWQEWKVGLVSGYRTDVVEQLRRVNQVPVSGTEFPKEERSFRYGNLVPKSGTSPEFPKGEQGSQNGNSVPKVGTDTEFPKQVPSSQNGNLTEYKGQDERFPKEERSSRNGNSVPESGTSHEFPKVEQGSQNGNSVPKVGTDTEFPNEELSSHFGNQVPKMGTELTHLSSTASKVPERIQEKKKDLKIHDHDDEIKSLREDFQQYASVSDAYEQIFGSDCNPFILKQLNPLMENGLEDAVIMYYFQKTRALDKDFSYAKACITNAYQQGVRSLKDAVEADKAFEARKQQKAAGMTVRETEESGDPMTRHGGKYQGFYEVLNGQREVAVTAKTDTEEMPCNGEETLALWYRVMEVLRDRVSEAQMSNAYKALEIVAYYPGRNHVKISYPANLAIGGLNHYAGVLKKAIETVTQRNATMEFSKERGVNHA